MLGFMHEDVSHVLYFCNIIYKIVVEHTARILNTFFFFLRMSNTVASYTRAVSFPNAAPTNHETGTPGYPV